jgi:Sulfatase
VRQAVVAERELAPLRPTSKAKFLESPIISAFSLSILVCLVLISPLADPRHVFVYHSSAPLTSVFFAVFLDLGVLWLVLGIVLTLSQRRGALWVAIWAGIIILGPWVVLKEATLLTFAPFPHWASLAIFFGPALCCGMLLLGRRRSLRASFLRVQRFVSALLGVYGIYGVLLLSQFLWSFWEIRTLSRSLPLHQKQVGSADPREKRSRLIWIVLDELSYQQVYGQRFARLELPAFDTLAKQATVFTHVIPAEAYTQKVLPALMSGSPVDAVRSSADGRRLDLHDPVTDRWHAFDPSESVFQDALNAGYHTAIVGWYIPYCRLLPQVLDRCYWVDRQAAAAGMFATEPVIKNAVAPLRRIFALGLRFFGFPERAEQIDSELTQLHIDDYRDLLAASDQRLEDASTNFLLLHMPVPHPGGIYDRKREVFATQSTSYVDNLALADQYLGHVYSILKDRNEWDSSTVVIMGDHSWRTQLIWADSSFWTSEDAAASHGGSFDDRPAYIIKLAYQNRPLQIVEAFPALRTRALLRGVLSGRIQSSEDLVEFARNRRSY